MICPPLTAEKQQNFFGVFLQFQIGVDMEALGFTYKTAAFVWVKKNAKNGGNYMGLGAYTRANAEVCLLGVSPGFKAGERVRSHSVCQIIEAQFQGHSKKPDETRRRIV